MDEDYDPADDDNYEYAMDTEYGIPEITSWEQLPGCNMADLDPPF